MWGCESLLCPEGSVGTTFLGVADIKEVRKPRQRPLGDLGNPGGDVQKRQGFLQ